MDQQKVHRGEANETKMLQEHNDQNDYKLKCKLKKIIHIRKGKMRNDSMENDDDCV